MNKNLTTLVEKLRQEQEFVSFYKQQIRQSVQELNNSCDQVFQSLWLSHTLSYGLHRVLAHNSHAYEWSRAFSTADTVKFVNASKVVKSHLFVDRYSKFLASLLNSPDLLADILNHVESEGLDCSWLINDLMSVVYGHCIFKKDHVLFLKLMYELLKQHIKQCDQPKDLFGGVESVFNRVLTEYCSQLVDLRTFLTLVMHDPLMQVLACEEYLEFDVNKAGSRFQKNSEQNGLVGSAAFLFNEDLDSSCDKLAKLASLFLENLSSLSSQFPVSLQWLLAQLKIMVKQKWPHVSASELRRPISDAIFSSILGSAIVNPDNFGVVDPSLIISDVGRYNLTQILSVLQGCVWIMDKPSGAKYPIQKVVRRMDEKIFFSLVDRIDGGVTGSIPELPSFLPGVNRSAFLASQDQLDNMVGLVAMLVSNREGHGSFHSALSNLLNALLPAMIEKASHNPYLITSKSPHALPLSPPNPPDQREQQEKVKSLNWKRKKTAGSVEILDMIGTGPGGLNKRGRSLISSHSTPDGKHKPPSEKQIKRSMSSDAGFSPPVLASGFRLPELVMVFPVLEKLEEGTCQWDFYLLTEEEFMGQKSPSPVPKSEDQFFSSFLRSQPPPRTLELTTPPVMAAGLRNSKQAEDQITNMLRANLGSRGRVKSMINAFEMEERARSNTLPNTLGSKGQPEGVRNNSSAGGTPVHTSPLLNGRRRISDNPSDQSDSLDRTNSYSNRTGYPSPGSGQRFKHEPRKLSTTLEVSMEESISYVKVVHPPNLSNGSSGLPQHAEEGEGEGEEREGRECQTEEVFVTVGSREQSCDSIGVSLDLEHSGEGVNTDIRLDDTSDELDREVLDTNMPTQNDSLVNLYQEAESEGGEGESPQRGKQKKKKKWKGLFKKRKSTEEQQDLVKPARSQSDAPSEIRGVELRGPKVRSASHDTFLDGGEGEGRGKGRRKVDRYTVFMQDYTNKLKNLSPKRDTEANEEEVGGATSGGRGLDMTDNNDDDRGSTGDMLERVSAVEATPPADMTPLTFKQSLFCSQLKYKLRSALQNIHTPLDLSHTLQQLQLQNGYNMDTRYQLILLIQQAMQRTLWQQKGLETALLTEILRMVEPLSDSHIQVTIDGVLEDYHTRSSYIAYLVCSQQKFQDAKMQVAAVQEATKRIMQINTDLFVNFAIRTFVETPGQPRLLQLKDFSQQLESLFLADEKCILMNNQLSSFRTALGEDLTWEKWQDTEVVMYCLSNYLFTYAHQHIFYPNGSTDKERDKIFSDHLAALSKTISMTHRSLQIPFVYHSGCPWVAAQKELKSMAAYKSPHGKLHCIVQSLRILISLLQYARCGDPPGADDLFPVLVYVLIKSNPPAMLSTCQYIRTFAEPSLQGEDAYWWAQFSTAVEFTKTLS